ncbi:hypothetical protein CKAN_00433900 [Cinnamomum micranthum f. kanehirae]|uniref:Uncharacterized protein n=1 Tax=Cinnamomum micranthum f. kanehirae TaxID=337451 RepID=A0A3S3MA26_9MAGN|nr:hypothetical protein CKAN_00433900 [Cinnamomum micranthum f. kanehirae]
MTTKCNKPIFRSKLERQMLQLTLQSNCQAPSRHHCHKQDRDWDLLLRDEDDDILRAKKKNQQQSYQKLLADAINEHLRCYQQPSKRHVVNRSKKLQFSCHNNEDTTRLYDPSCPLFCLRLRANANKKDDKDKPHKNQNQKNCHWFNKNLDDMTD